MATIDKGIFHSLYGGKPSSVTDYNKTLVTPQVEINRDK